MGISEENLVKTLVNRAFSGRTSAVIPCFRLFQPSYITQFSHPPVFQAFYLNLWHKIGVVYSSREEIELPPYKNRVLNEIILPEYRKLDS